jgi:hypothetical protein
MTTAQMHQFARMGAEARLTAIQEEQQAILRVFPDLRDGAALARRTSPASRGRRRRMSAATRKAAAERMRAYWAKRRAKKASVEKSAAKRKRKGGMSVEARRRQGERMRAYWAAKRAPKVDGADEGTQSETAGQNGAPSSNRGETPGRKQGPKK